MNEKPEISDIILTEGIELKKRGSSYWGLCPFHIENTASFKVDPNKGLFHCFGCGIGGDVIKFVMAYHGLDFKGALKYLGLRGNKPKPKKIRQRNHRKFLINQFKQWQECTSNFLADIYCENETKLLHCKTIEEVGNMSWWYHSKSVMEYWLDILTSNDTDAKLILYKNFRRRGCGL